MSTFLDVSELSKLNQSDIKIQNNWLKGNKIKGRIKNTNQEKRSKNSLQNSTKSSGKI